ncbi:MAG: hypothetical protein JETT_1869 [Candidatus Jettenia ecosi]|uniref:Uncharacterized protein n=1 Tax=Candidatus Jettenia ecosi TaxID=2494326 RepID=A0A533QB05_9BACT|nr:MAG: hypothetical protein JETT_1869 [Candidatus Jettenia ecosi]
MKVGQHFQPLPFVAQLLRHIYYASVHALDFTTYVLINK